MSEAQQPTQREVLHFRAIEMTGSRRPDGLYEVEGRVTDRKTTRMGPMLSGRIVEPMEPLHDMGVRIVFDEDLTVHDVDTFTDASPHGRPCAEGGASLQTLKGLSMKKGWGKAVRDRLSGARSCTHLMELLGPLATVAFQTLAALRVERARQAGVPLRRTRVDTCYALAADGDLVKTYIPDLYRPRAETPPHG